MVIDALRAGESESPTPQTMLRSNEFTSKVRLAFSQHPSVNPAVSRIVALAEHPVARATTQQKHTRRGASALDQADEFYRCCAQAIAITGLLMEADADSEIQDAAWAVQSLIEQMQAIGEALFHSPRRLAKS